MSIPVLIRSYPASADVEPFRIVKFSDAAATSKVATAAAATDPLFGVSDALGANSGGMLDTIIGGLAEVTLGGTVTAGAPITSDADGKAIAAVGAAGVTKRVIGFAEQPGVAGDRIMINVVPGVLQLPAAA